MENGFADPDKENRLKNKKKKDSKELFSIQQAVYSWSSQEFQ